MSETDDAGAQEWSIEQALAHLRAVDPELGTLIGCAPRCDLPTAARPDVFAYLVRSIVYQQLSGSAAGTIHGRLVSLVADRGMTPQALLERSHDELRSVGVSAAKANAIHALAVHARDGDIPSADEAQCLSDVQMVRRITVVKGIGPWTVHMLLMFGLGRPDVMPTGDYGVRAGYARWYGLPALPTPAELERRTADWAPFRSAGSWYMWRALEVEPPQ